MTQQTAPRTAEPPVATAPVHGRLPGVAARRRPARRAHHPRRLVAVALPTLLATSWVVLGATTTLHVLGAIGLLLAALVLGAVCLTALLISG